MAGPITWRSIMGAQPAEAARPMAYAQQSINGAFDQLTKTLNDRQAIETQNWDVQKTNNTQNFLDQLAKYRTPEALAAAQASGELAQMQQGFGAQIDRSAVRNAADTRLDTLYKQTQEANKYADSKLDRDQAPIRDQIMSLATQGKAEEARVLLEANPTLRNAAEVHRGVVGGERDLTKFGWERDEQARKGETHTDQLKTTASQRQTAAAQRGLIGVQTRGAQLTNQETEMSLNEKRQLEAIQKRLAAAAQQHGENSLPGTRDGSNPDASMPTDTQAFQKTMAELRQEGFAPHLLEKLRPTAQAIFDSRNFTAPVGKDAAEVRAKSAKEEAQARWFEENGIAAPGSTEGVRNVRPLVEFVNNVSKDPDEVKSLNTFIGKWSAKQVDVNGTKVSIPQSVMELAITQSNDNRIWGTRWLRDSNRGDNAEQVLKNLMKDPRVIEDIAARSELDAASVRKAFTKELLNIGNTGGTPPAKKSK